MDKDTLQIVIMVAGFAITIITFLLKFPSRDEMNNSRYESKDGMNQRINDINQRINDINQRLIDLSADVRNIYHILMQGKSQESEKDD